jgi:hypothetical protein
MATNALGIDISGVEDIDLFLSYADGPRAAAEAVMRSLLHDSGRLWWAPDSGHDIRRYLHGFFDAGRIQAAVQAQCELDERVDSATVDATSLGDEIKIAVNLALTQDATQVQFTLTVNELGEVLSAAVAV